LSSTPYTSTTRPLDAIAAGIVVVLCLSWGFNQVATKLAIHDIPPLMQAAVRSFVAAFLIAAWCRLRGIPLFDRDGTLWFDWPPVRCSRSSSSDPSGSASTRRRRAVLLIYLAPFFVVLGARIVLPADRFGAAQWLGLGMSFAGMLIAFGVPTPALDPRQHIGDVMMVGGALFWAATTLTIKASALTRVYAEKVILYQLVVSGPIMAIAAFVVGERMTDVPSALAIGSMIYQTVWVVSVTFVIWFALIARYSATRLSAFTFLTPVWRCRRTSCAERAPDASICCRGCAYIGLVLVNRAR
jgi:drug/metabolite transporter (DMT)-like permease